MACAQNDCTVPWHASRRATYSFHMPVTPRTNASQTAAVQTLRAAFSANKLDKAQVLDAAKAQGLTLPADFFTAVRSDPLAAELKAPSQFSASDGAGSTGAGRVAELRMSATNAAKPKRELPNPAPDLIRVGKMNLKKLAQTPDMVVYINFIKGKPTLVYVMAKLDPATALSGNKSFGKDRERFVLGDRDGVFKNSSFLNTPDKEAAHDVMIPSALVAAKKLNEARIGLGLVTNQGGYEIGKMSFEDTIAINVRVSQQIANAGGHLDAIFICPFSSALEDPPAGVLDARKPSSGMTVFAKQLAEQNNIPVLGMIGDQRSDGAAGQGAGLKFYAVTDDNGRWTDERTAAERKHETLPSLNTATDAYEEHPSFASVVDKLLA